jgi:hypothetical protein
MLKIKKKFEDQLNFRGNTLAFYKLFKLVFVIIWVAHYCGCAFFFLGSVEFHYYGMTDTWLQIQKIENGNWLEQYITSFYCKFILILNSF